MISARAPFSQAYATEREVCIPGGNEMPSAASDTRQEEFEGFTILTSLRDLIEAIEDEVGPREDPLVAEIVLDLLEAGRIRFTDPRGLVKILCSQYRN